MCTGAAGICTGAAGMCTGAAGMCTGVFIDSTTWRRILTIQSRIILTVHVIFIIFVLF